MIHINGNTYTELGTDTFTCSNDWTTHKINYKFDCNEKC